MIQEPEHPAVVVVTDTATEFSGQQACWSVPAYQVFSPSSYLLLTIRLFPAVVKTLS